MTDCSIAERLSVLKADLAEPRPKEGPPESPPEEPSEGPGRERTIEDELAGMDLDLAGVGDWVKAHPLAAVGLCLAAGAVAGGLLKWGRGR